MLSRLLRVKSIIFLVVFVCGSIHGGLNHFEQNGDIEFEWVLLGTFPNEKLPEDQWVNGVRSAGFHKDYLIDRGGEAVATLKHGDIVKYTDDEGVVREATTKVVHRENGEIVDFSKTIVDQADVAAYAYCEFDADEDQRVYALFGSDDRAKVWINGEKVHEFGRHGRSLRPGEDRFYVDIKKGSNRLLVKVENSGGGWGYAIQLLGQAEFEAFETRLKEERIAEKFCNLKIGAMSYRGLVYAFQEGAFPKIDFEIPERAKDYLGEYTVHVSWFDSNLNEVKGDAKPGRYGAIVKVTSDNGLEVNRGYSFFCYPAGYNWWREVYDVDVAFFDGIGVEEDVWNEQNDKLGEDGVNALKYYFFKTDHGAGMIAGMHDRANELKRNPQTIDPYWLTPTIRNHDYLLAMRLKTEGKKNKEKLALPRAIKTGEYGQTVKEGSLEEAGFKVGFKDAMKETCQEWVSESGVPFNVMVVRNGVIAYHGAYERSGSNKVTVETPYPVASISKLMFSTALSMFREQGLIELDEPLGKYVDGFPVSGEKMFTVRQSMMHMAGMTGHMNYGSFYNLWFDDQVKQKFKFMKPGKEYRYNGLSLNMVGRACELVSGESFARIMQAHLWAPLGCKDTTSIDTSTGTRTTAADMARLGQMLLNGGVYGDHYFFSEKTRDEMLPIVIGTLYPDVSNNTIEYGLACSWYRDVGEMNEKGERVSSFGRMFGHGSATASIFRVDLDNQLVITMARPAGGKGYDRHYQAMFKVIADHMIK
ncbi:beta-lactamase family protein [Planctomycetota bacterium]|nr:beta-lactamase family protein [Planctomycetota bacterium]